MQAVELIVPGEPPVYESTVPTKISFLCCGCDHIPRDEENEMIKPSRCGLGCESGWLADLRLCFCSNFW